MPKTSRPARKTAQIAGDPAAAAARIAELELALKQKTEELDEFRADGEEEEGEEGEEGEKPSPLALALALCAEHGFVCLRAAEYHASLTASAHERTAAQERAEAEKLNAIFSGSQGMMQEAKGQTATFRDWFREERVEREQKQEQIAKLQAELAAKDRASEEYRTRQDEIARERHAIDAQLAAYKARIEADEKTRQADREAWLAGLRDYMPPALVFLAAWARKNGFDVPDVAAAMSGMFGVPGAVPGLGAGNAPPASPPAGLRFSLSDADLGLWDAAVQQLWTQVLSGEAKALARAALLGAFSPDGRFPKVTGVQVLQLVRRDVATAGADDLVNQVMEHTVKAWVVTQAHGANGVHGGAGAAGGQPN